MSVVYNNTAESSITLGKARRILLAAIGVGLLTALSIARTLHPSPFGFGTHQQLGLPPCTFTALFGIRCPSCGMTTSWAYLTRGQLFGALESNTGGVLLGFVSLLASPWLLVSSLRGRWWIWTPSDRRCLGIGSFIAAVTLVDWFWRLWCG